MPISRSLPSTSRVLSRGAGCLLALALGIGVVGAPAVARATTPTSGPTGLHDGMMPSGSPDAKHTTGIAAAATTGSTPPPVGPDVSRWQHPSGAAIDWTQVAASGQSFAIVKATELYTDSGQAVLYTNPYLHGDLDGAHAAGLVVGAYAFAHPENSAIAQADDLAAAIGTLPPGSLPPVLDLEQAGGLSVSALISWTHAFLDRLQADTGTLPMIYTGPNFWKTYLGNTTEFAGYPLWEAHYTTAAAPMSIGGWSSYTLWQYTDAASIPGISGGVDQSRFNNTTGATLSNLHSPTGTFDSALVTGAGTLTVSGWALDPDTPTVSNRVDVYVDGQRLGVTANVDRPDVAAVYPAAGSQHGFVATTTVDPGSHTVCVYSIDTADGSQSTGLGCKTAKFLGSWFYLNDSFSGQANIVLSYGDPKDTVLVANTSGTGGDKLLIRRGNQYYVRNSLTSGTADFTFVYGDPGDTVLIGDWDGDGKDTLAVRRGNVFYFRNSLTSGPADAVIAYGDPGDTILVGDWNGDGKDTLAVRRGNQYFVKNAISSGVADTVFTYGNTDDTVLVGHWSSGQTGDSLGVRRGNAYYLKYSLASGPADLAFYYGNPDDTVIVGDWNGNGVDTLGVRRVA